MLKKYTGYKRLLALAAMSGGAAQVERTATGNPLTFQTDLARPLKSLLIPFTPVQSGTGDPSPQNVRPLVPREGLKVYHSGADTSNPTETDISFPSPVYGGTLDVVSGVLTVEWASYTFNGSESMSLGSYSGTGGIRINTSDIDYLNPAYNMAISDIAIKYPTVPTVIDSLGFRIGSGTAVFAFFVPHSMFDGEATIEKFKEWLASHNMTICTKLATPTEQTLTGHQLTALIGNNTIWSDADGSMTAVYLLTESFGDDHPISGGLGSGLLGGGFGSGSGEPDEPSEPDEPGEPDDDTGDDQPDEPAEPDQPEEP